MRQHGIIVAIDGPAGAGKSTVARALADRLGYVYVDTGAMYRVIGLLAFESGVAADDAEALGRLTAGVSIRFEAAGAGAQRVFADGRDVTEAIRGQEIGQWASKVSAVPVVRERLVGLQRDLGAEGGVVLEGRDIGTVVFPDADVKFFLEASAGERGRRRFLELGRRGQPAVLEEIVAEIEERDRRDSSRAHSPLRPAADAERVDTMSRGAEEVIEYLLRRCRETLARVRR